MLLLVNTPLTTRSVESTDLGGHHDGGSHANGVPRGILAREPTHGARTRRHSQSRSGCCRHGGRRWAGQNRVGGECPIGSRGVKS